MCVMCVGGGGIEGGMLPLNHKAYPLGMQFPCCSGHSALYPNFLWPMSLLAKKQPETLHTLIVPPLPTSPPFRPPHPARTPTLMPPPPCPPSSPPLPSEHCQH